MSGRTRTLRTDGSRGGGGHPSLSDNNNFMVIRCGETNSLWTDRHVGGWVGVVRGRFESKGI